MKDEMRKLAYKYEPIIMVDKSEPFEIKAMGCTLFKETKRSESFPKRQIVIDHRITDFAIEYAVWFDYDIQHLYELEHVWVYVDRNKKVQKVEGSFHGKFLNMVDLEAGEPVLQQETHPVVYAQPGKHAMVPDPRVIRLVPEWRECCMEKAGEGGVLVQDFFKDKIHTDDKLQKMTQAYIKHKYGFRPTLEFQPFLLAEEKLTDWEELKQSIPERVEQELRRIRKYFGVE